MAQKIQVEYEANISKLQKDLKKLEAQQSKVKKQAVDTGQTLTNLSTKQAKQLEKLINLRKTAVRIGKKRNQEAIRALDQEIVALKKAGTATKQLTSETKKLDKGSSGLNKTLTNIGRNLAVAFSIGALVQFGRQLSRTAIEMEAFQKRAKVVFGDSIQLIKQFAAENALALGFTESEFQGATAAIGDLVVPLGLSRERAAEMSVELVKVGVALKEFTGDTRDAQDISDILARSLTGEVESLKPLGVTVSLVSKEFQNLVKQKMRDEGATLLQAKALAIYETIIQRSNDAITSFEENTDTLSRSQAELNANLRSVQEELAVFLTPALKIASEAILDQIKFVNDSSSGWERFAKILQFLSPVTTAATIANALFNKSQKESVEIQEESIPTREQSIELRKEEIKLTKEQREAIKALQKVQNELRRGNKKFREEVFRDIESAEDQIEDLRIQTTENALQRDLDRIELQRERELESVEKTLATDEQKLTLQGLIQDKFNKESLDRQIQAAEQSNQVAQAQAQKELQIELAKQEALQSIIASAGDITVGLVAAIGGAKAQQSKEFAIFEIAIAEAVAIAELVKDVQKVGITPIEKAALFAAGFAQLLSSIGQARAVLDSATLPKVQTTVRNFAEGEIDIQGGQSGRDSIPAMLTPHESIMKEKATGKYKEELIAANNLNLESFINNKYVLPAIVKVRGDQAFAERWMAEHAFDDTSMLRQMKKPIKVGNVNELAKAISKQSSDQAYFSS